MLPTHLMTLPFPPVSLQKYLKYLHSCLLYSSTDQYSQTKAQESYAMCSRIALLEQGAWTRWLTVFPSSLWFCDSLIPTYQPKPTFSFYIKKTHCEYLETQKLNLNWNIFSSVRGMLPVERSVLSTKCSNKSFPFVAPAYFSSHICITKNLSVAENT